jgi:hypothetical protein
MTGRAPAGGRGNPENPGGRGNPENPAGATVFLVSAALNFIHGLSCPSAADR